MCILKFLLFLFSLITFFFLLEYIIGLNFNMFDLVITIYLLLHLLFFVVLSKGCIVE